ncbi:hypothetical protein I312_100963 [Cryptococcus bacillisporus CA1280]|uniref:uncharacterized protein n=1 Tax=Cryptococcus bacillisporus CA1280 TaxID=1296109 RepID=UPI003366FC54
MLVTSHHLAASQWGINTYYDDIASPEQMKDMYEHSSGAKCKGILFFVVQHHPEQLPGCVAPVLDKHVEEEILI